MSFSELYDKKYLLKCLCWFFIVFGLMRVTNGAGFAIVVLMIFYASLASRTETLLFWLLVSVCSLIVNPHLVLKGSFFAYMQRGVMVFLGLYMSASVMSYPVHGVLRPYAGILFYVLVMVLSSAQGWNPKISFLKLILFSLIYFACFGVSNQVGINPQVSSRRIRSIMLSVAVFFILGSVALVPFPGISLLNASDIAALGGDLSSHTSLFMGMTNQSQTLGTITAVMACILLGDLLFSIKKADGLYLVMLFCCPYLVYKTSSRTGMGSFILSQLFVLWVFMHARGIGGRWKSKVMSVAMVIMTFLLIAIASIPSLQAKATKFILKTHQNEDKVSSEAVLSSRQALMDKAIYNFKKSPMLGNGFQVSEEMKSMKQQGFMILSAPIEKGVWITAVLEEGGVIGWTIFVLFLVVCIWTSIKRRAYIGASCLFALTMTNLGEFSFFSMSYIGGFIWLMVFVGLALDLRKMNDENEALRQQMEFEQMQMGLMEGGGQI